MQGRRVLLDTNVWSRVSSARAGTQLRVAATRAGAEIIAAPSALYELTRMPDATSRRRALRLVTETWLTRLMPEAYLEAAEIVSAIRRHRPQWLVEHPQLGEFGQLEYDWRRRNTPATRRLRSHRKAGVWERFRHAPDLAEAELKAIEGELMASSRRQSESARSEMLEQGVRDPGPLRSIRSAFVGPYPGWRGDDFEAWRGETLVSLRYNLFAQQRGAYVDWISPFVELSRIAADAAGWTEFWLYEIQAAEVPRQWLRWAIQTQQRFRKVSPGASGDAQLAAYLVDADMLISTDKQFVELVSACVDAAPAPIAKAILIPGDERSVPSLLEMIGSLGPSWNDT
jgi:hypothetical protein